MKDFQISVIIPAYNCERFVEEAIHSVIHQSLKPFEIIVVDDGSTDSTKEKIAVFKDAVRYIYQSNSGSSVARNRGIREAKGNYFSFLDADDIWVHEKLEKQATAFITKHDLDAAFGYAKNFHSPVVCDMHRDKIKGVSEPMPAYVPGSMLIKRESFFRVGYYEPKWIIGEVIDWYMKAKELNLMMAIIPDVVLMRRLHADNKGIREQKFQTQYIRIIKAALDRRRKNTTS